MNSRYKNIIFIKTIYFPGFQKLHLKPLAVDKYNKHMLGVCLNQQMAYYHGNLCVSEEVFFWIIEVVNSYILYTTHTDARCKLSHKDFRSELVMEESSVPLSLIAQDDRGETRPWSSCVDHTTLSLEQSVVIVACVMSEVQGVDDFSPVPSAAHVAITPTYVSGNAFVSITHKLTCNYITLLKTLTLITLLLLSYKNLQHYNQVSRKHTLINSMHACQCYMHRLPA